jgi:Zn-dependent M28 family amino/carboxypeptidase
MTISIVACAASTPQSAQPGSSQAPTPTTSAKLAWPTIGPSASASQSGTTPPAPPPDAVQKLAAAPSHAFDVVKSLTDEVGPRSAGSDGDRAAVAWAMTTLAQSSLANVHSEKVMVRHWERGAETAEITTPVHQPLRVTALGGSVATPQAGLEAEVIEVASVDDLKAMSPGSLTGKIAFINTVMKRAKDGKGYGDAVGARYSGARAAQKAGASAVIIRSVGTDYNRLPHTGAKSKDDDEIPAGALSIPDADLLHDVIAAHKSAKVKLTLTPRLLPDAESADVVGEVRGREKPDEVVLLGAHLDSWDLGTGALDDGAGCAIMIDAARRVAELPQPPRRTVRVVLFANEEAGREGAKTYAQVHGPDAAKIVAAMEADFGSDRVYATRYLGGADGLARFQTIAGWIKPLGVDVDTDDANSGADIGPLRELGVPVLELRQDGSRYFDFHHTANDTLDKIDADAIAQAATVFAITAWGAAESDGDFGRVPDDKRKEKW